MKELDFLTPDKRKMNLKTIYSGVSGEIDLEMFRKKKNVNPYLPQLRSETKEKPQNV